MTLYPDPKVAVLLAVSLMQPERGASAMQNLKIYLYTFMSRKIGLRNGQTEGAFVLTSNLTLTWELSEVRFLRGIFQVRVWGQDQGGSPAFLSHPEHKWVLQWSALHRRQPRSLYSICLVRQFCSNGLTTLPSWIVKSPQIWNLADGYSMKIL